MDHLIPHPELYNLPFSVDAFNGMPYRAIGRSGLRASQVGLGLWKIGLPETGDGSRVGEKAAYQILDRAIELGVTFWDTANRYNASSGNSERVIGRWLKANPDQRRNVVLATKIYGVMDGKTPNHCRLSRANILDSVYASLARLQAEHIDLLYFHALDPATPVEESLAAVEDLVQRDLVRYFGISNVTADQLRQYQQAEAGSSIRTRVIAVQNGFDILHGEQAESRGVLKACQESGVSFIAWSPLARGLLTGRYLDRSRAAKGDRLVDEGSLERDLDERTSSLLTRLDGAARSLGLELSQLALAYMLAMPGMGPVIPGVTFWDTAHRYNASSGNSERVIGRWLKAHPDQRRNIVLATKIYGVMDGMTPNHCRLSRANILDSVYTSLARLQTEHIDLLYFHALDPSTPVEESLATVEDLVQRDLVRYFGISNVTVSQLRQYQQAEAGSSIRTRVIAVQNGFDILHGEQAESRGVLKACQESGVSFIAWSPLARGLLTGRYLDRSRAGKGDRLVDEGSRERDLDERTSRLLTQLDGAARSLDLELSQLALAYMLAMPGMGPVIPGVTSPAQLESNAKAGQVSLSADQVRLVQSILESR